MRPLLGAVVALACAGLLVATAMVAGRRPPSDGKVVAVGCAVSVLTGLGLYAAGPGGLVTLAGWIIGFGAVVIAVAGLEGRPRVVILAVGLQIAVVGAFATADRTAGFPLGAFVTPLVVVGTALFIGAGMRQGRAGVDVAAARLAITRQQERWHADVQRQREIRMARLRTDIRPFLDQMVAADHVSDQDQVTAAVLGAQCRDEVWAAGSMPDEIRDHVRSARLRGVKVAISPPTRPPRLTSGARPGQECVRNHRIG